MGRPCSSCSARLRQRGILAHRIGGHLQQRVGLPPSEGIRARACSAVMSLTLGTLVLGVSLLAHFTHAVPYVQGSPTVISAGGQGLVRHRFDRPDGLPRWCSGDPPHPLHRGQHQLQRLPVPGQLRRRGPIPAANPDPPRPPAHLLQRDPRPRCGRHRPVGDHPGQGERAREPVRHRRVHRVHHGRVWDGEAPLHPQGAGAAAQGVDQRERGRRVVRRRHHLRHHQVHRRGLGGGGALPGSDVPADPDQPPLPERGGDPGRRARPSGPSKPGPSPAISPSCWWTTWTWPRRGPSSTPR